MERLLTKGRYKSGKRPSGQYISKSAFATDHGGATPPSVLSISKTRSQDPYQNYCRDQQIVFHPARMPAQLPEFPGDVVPDPFGASNAKAAAAETLGRSCVAVEPYRDYIAGSLVRFDATRVRVARKHPE
jgi:site-specific DNA-methyltransferase (cytosine-N4-specific)